MDTKKRVFKLAEYDLIGFDLDHTFVRYNVRKLEKLCWDILTAHLVSRCGYPESLKEIQFDPTFAMKGLILDAIHGNVIALDEHAAVSRGFHGWPAKPLAEDQLVALYGPERKVPFSGEGDRTYVALHTYFVTCMAQLYLVAVQLYDDGKLAVRQEEKVLNGLT